MLLRFLFESEQINRSMPANTKKTETRSKTDAVQATASGRDPWTAKSTAAKKAPAREEQI